MCIRDRKNTIPEEGEGETELVNKTRPFPSLDLAPVPRKNFKALNLLFSPDGLPSNIALSPDRKTAYHYEYDGTLHAISTDYIIPPTGQYYFRVRLERLRNRDVMVGVTLTSNPLQRLYDIRGSWLVYAYNYQLYGEKPTEPNEYGAAYLNQHLAEVGDIITSEIDMDNLTATFKINGHVISVTRMELNEEERSQLRPVVCLRSGMDQVSLIDETE
eukprot:TRINITY_DN27774_c0_g1_i1.p1 TRINITY_DN27774_c0_g1~~TRINITY_DN27774_c0_g1_i1.p1  ORF type:complete len:216 (+),score=19.08 TRINITY_DN27774_c0_g1_i1:64-711(+)